MENKESLLIDGLKKCGLLENEIPSIAEKMETYINEIILFKAVKSNGSSTTFQVEPEIAQDFKNENSFIYKLAKKSDLVAKKTGNLVVINTCSSSNDMQIDLLIDIDA